MSAELIKAIKANTDAIKEQTLVLQGLTGVLIEDREAEDGEATPDTGTQQAVASLYLDGSSVGG